MQVLHHRQKSFHLRFLVMKGISGELFHFDQSMVGCNDYNIIMAMIRRCLRRRQPALIQRAWIVAFVSRPFFMFVPPTVVRQPQQILRRVSPYSNAVCDPMRVWLTICNEKEKAEKRNVSHVVSDAAKLKSSEVVLLWRPVRKSYVPVSCRQNVSRFTNKKETSDE